MGKRRRWTGLLLLPFLLVLFCLPARADAGPKPSVTVTLEGLEGRACWGTLLSPRGTGPYSVLSLDSGQSCSDDPEEDAAFHAFAELEQEETGGFFLLSFVQDCSQGTFSWTYYPPSVFRLALWFPEENAFVVGPVCQRYAFDSYYGLDLTQLVLSPGETVQVEQLSRDYPYGQELLALAGRIALTWAVEVGLALVFGFRAKRQLAWIAGVNLATQGLLNLGLNAFTYFCGPLAGMTALFLLPVYLLLELAVIAVELAVYRRTLAAGEGKSRRRVTWYAWTANAASYLIGVLLSFQLEGMF